MLKLLFFIISFITFENTVNAQIGLIKPQKKPPKFANSPGCYLRDNDVMIAYEDTFTPPDNDRCELFKCGLDGYIEITACLRSDTTPIAFRKLKGSVQPKASFPLPDISRVQEISKNIESDFMKVQNRDAIVSNSKKDHAFKIASIENASVNRNMPANFAVRILSKGADHASDKSILYKKLQVQDVFENANKEGSSPITIGDVERQRGEASNQE